jgi:hypothetical protein
LFAEGQKQSYKASRKRAFRQNLLFPTSFKQNSSEEAYGEGAYQLKWFWFVWQETFLFSQPKLPFHKQQPF